jgi:hypothetical protein
MIKTTATFLTQPFLQHQTKRLIDETVTLDLIEEWPQSRIQLWLSAGS